MARFKGNTAGVEIKRGLDSIEHGQNIPAEKGFQRFRRRQQISRRP